MNFFSNEINETMQSNLFGEEWKALRALEADKTIVSKAASKWSLVVAWGRSDYLQIFRRFLDNYRIQTSLRMSGLAKIYL